MGQEIVSCAALIYIADVWLFGCYKTSVVIL